MEQKSLTPTQECEGVVVIPSDYAEEGVVPICIRTIDDDGRRVHRGWIEAVRPIAETVRGLAAHVIGNVHQVSELADGSVHPLSAKFGSKLGRSPSMRIFVMAKYLAQDLSVVGGRRARLGMNVGLTDKILNSLRDEHDFSKAYEDREFLDRLKDELNLAGKKDELKMLNLYLTNRENKIAAVFGGKSNSQERNTVSHRFWRSIAQGAERLRHGPTH